MHTLLAACAEPGNQSKPFIFLTYAGARSLPDPSRTHAVPNAADYAHTQPISKSARHTGPFLLPSSSPVSFFLPLHSYFLFLFSSLLFLSCLFLSFPLHSFFVPHIAFVNLLDPSRWVILLYPGFSYSFQSSPYSTFSRVLVLYPKLSFFYSLQGFPSL